MDDLNNRITNRLPTDTPPPSVAMLRLIVTALIIGACVFGGTVLFSASRIGAKVFDNAAVAWALDALSAVAIGLQFAIPKMMRPVAGADETADLKRYGVMTLIRVGILEAMAVLNYIAYLLSQHDATIIAGAVLVLTMLLIRPSDEKFRRWRDAV